MIREILTYPKDKDMLTQKSEEVKEITEEVKVLVQDLTDTLNYLPTGAGLSAIQIGIPMKVCVIKYNGQIIPIINPIVTRTSKDKVWFREGCLSAPGVFTQVERYRKVTIEYLDIEGRKRSVAQGGLFSIIIQHELDHFDGWCHVFEEEDRQNEEFNNENGN